MPIYKDEKRGTWYISEYINKKRIVRRGFKKNKDAKDALKLLQNEKVGICKDITLDEAYNLFLEDYKQHSKANSISMMDVAYRLYIKDYFKGVPIKKITSINILSWKKHMIDNNTHLAVSSWNIILARLKMIFKFAANHLGLEKSPCDNIVTFKETEDTKESEDIIKFITYDEFFNRVENIKNEKYKTLFKFLFLQGSRIGEALALRVKDLNFDFKKITIEWNWGLKKDGKYGLIKPKNKYSERTIDMFDQTKELLEKHIKDNNLKQDDFVFFRNSHMTNKWKIFDSEFSELRIHHLRHSCISWLLSLGIDPMYIAELVGHKDTSMITKIYGHLYKESKKAMLNVINNSSRDTIVIPKNSKNSII